MFTYTYIYNKHKMINMLNTHNINFSLRVDLNHEKNEFRRS